MSDISFPLEIWQLIIYKLDTSCLGNMFCVCQSFLPLIIIVVQSSPSRLSEAISQNCRFIFKFLRNINNFRYTQAHYIYSIIHDRVECFTLLWEKDNVNQYTEIILKYLKQNKPKQIILKYYPELVPELLPQLAPKTETPKASSSSNPVNPFLDILHQFDINDRINSNKHEIMLDHLQHLLFTSILLRSENLNNGPSAQLILRDDLNHELELLKILNEYGKIPGLENYVNFLKSMQ
jgi:hypothetical protein